MVRDDSRTIRITAAICAHNEAATLPDALASLQRQSLDPSGFEILVIDNASTDGTKDVLQSLKTDGVQLNVISEPTPGLSNARNRALAEAAGEIVAFLDADAIAGADWLADLLRTFDEHPGLGAAGGRIEIQWDHDRPDWWDSRLEEALNAFDPGEEGHVLTYPRYPYGTNFAVRRDAALELGGFRTSLGRIGRRLIAGEEGELCLRLEQAGWMICAAGDGAVVHHRTAANRLTRSFVLRRAFNHGRSQRVIERMHHMESSGYPTWLRLGRILFETLGRLDCDLPFWKFFAFRLGYRVQATIDRFRSRLRRQRIGVVVQARMSSARLPGKVLRVCRGKPMLMYLIERLQRCRSIDEIIIATSDDASDHPIALFCDHNDLACYRGPLDDVLARFVGAAESHGFDSVVHVCGDSPLIDPHLIDRAVTVIRSCGGDLVTNISPRTFPAGQSVEVMSMAALRSAHREASAGAGGREHVTQWLYEHADRFAIRSIQSATDYSGERLCIDTPEDWAMFESLIAQMDQPQWHYTLQEILQLKRSAAPPAGPLPKIRVPMPV